MLQPSQFRAITTIIIITHNTIINHSHKDQLLVTAPEVFQLPKKKWRSKWICSQETSTRLIMTTPPRSSVPSRKLDSRESCQEFLPSNYMTSHSPGQKLDNTRAYKKVWNPSNISKITWTPISLTPNWFKNSLSTPRLFNLNSVRNSTMVNSRTQLRTFQRRSEYYEIICHKSTLLSTVGKFTNLSYSI